ncbi:MAG: MerR family transcriptional regulator [Candidatus Sericytochromatia bacterium]|nr:MerR family transcriptional regulator [Candidatus Sericytochromatia bacterium]
MGLGQNDQPVYIMSVAAQLVNMHPQTLRLYERRGLVIPKRQGKNRLYSQDDIERLLYIQRLTQELGINLAGVEMISQLQSELETLKQGLQRDALTLKRTIEDLG